MGKLDPGLEGQVAIVTGANSGIGRGIAEAFAGVGAKVVVAGRDEGRNADVVNAIRAAGGDAISVRGDMTVEADIITLVAKTIDTYGQIDICVANAGGIADVGEAPIDQMETRVWRSVLALNLDAPFFLYREASRHMIRAGRGGSLIGTSSVSSIRSVGGAFHYSAAKGGLNALTMSLADYLGPHDIRINAIIPGFIESASTAPLFSDKEFLEGVIKRIPMRRIGIPADVGSLAVFLASSQSSFITGQTFVIDGGQTPRMVTDPPLSVGEPAAVSR